MKEVDLKKEAEVNMKLEEQKVRVEIPEGRTIFPEYIRGKLRYQEFMYEEEFEFEKGKMYGIYGERGEGGGGLTWLLSGRGIIQDENVTVFGRRYKKGKSVQEGWYMSEGIPNINKSARKQISIALKRSKSELSVQNIVDKFHLTEERLDLKLENYSWEVWRVSAAIGYALGKQIFCFPSMATLMVRDLITNAGFFIYVEKLKREGGILLLPSSNKNVLEAVSDEIIELNNPGFKDLSAFHEIVRLNRDESCFEKTEDSNL